MKYAMCVLQLLAGIALGIITTFAIMWALNLL
jgi:hypothetical protein